MADYSLEDLGKVVAGLRKEKGLTQEELGTNAGYGKGAGVSISRLENGRLEPTDKFEGIARALGLTVEQLEARAAGLTAATAGEAREGVRTQEERIAAIVQASERRKQIAPALEAFQAASKRAENKFLMRFREIAIRVSGTPSPDESGLEPGNGTDANEAEAEASYQIRFTQYGVSRALADSSGGAALAGALGGATYLAFTEAVALKAAPLGAVIPRWASAAAALNGLRAAMGVRRGGAASGMNLLAAVALGTVAVAILERQSTAKRNRKYQESAAKLTAAEADIAANQANVEALLDIFPRATEMLDYIAVHASHALERWGHQIGEEPVDWERLGKAEQHRYQDFVAIAAAQLALAAIDLQLLATSHVSDLERATAVADQILVHATRAITSRV